MAICSDAGSTPADSIDRVSGDTVRCQNADIKAFLIFLIVTDCHSLAVKVSTKYYSPGADES